MSASTPSNLPASIKQRLLNLSKQTGEGFNALLTKYASDRHFQLPASFYPERGVPLHYQDFLMPLVLAAVAGEKFNLFWPPGGPWKKKTD